MPVLLSIVRETCAKPTAFLPSLPEKIISSILIPLRVFALCSPNTQRIASTTFDLPLPLGPTTTVIPGLNSISTLSAKDLKP